MSRVTCPYCSRSGISVSLHDDSATCPECDLIFGVEVDVYAVALPESERTEPEKSPAPVWPTTDDPEWIQIGDRFWVTDGAALLRSDCPALPSEWDEDGGYQGWDLLSQKERAGAAANLKKPPAASARARFHPRFAPILAATEPVPGSTARTVAGQVVAIIMPLSEGGDRPSVDNRGQA